MPQHAIVIVLSVVMLASTARPHHEEAIASVTSTGSLPKNCGVGALTPRRHLGFIKAAGEAECVAPSRTSA
jgi:hypothetical protein